LHAFAKLQRGARTTRYQPLAHLQHHFLPQLQPTFPPLEAQVAVSAPLLQPSFWLPLLLSSSLLLLKPASSLPQPLLTLWPWQQHAPVPRLHAFLSLLAPSSLSALLPGAPPAPPACVTPRALAVSTSAKRTARPSTKLSPTAAFSGILARAVINTLAGLMGSNSCCPFG